MSRPVERTTQFRVDAEAIVGHYLEAAGSAVATRFVGALERAVSTIRLHPDAGAPIWAEAARLPGLRASSVPAFPCLVFSIPAAESTRLLRILHERRDLPVELRADANSPG